MSETTRDKMVASTAMLLREHGLSGTSVRDVVEHSGAPRGSVYHHFPGGKTEMVEAAVEWAGGAISDALAQFGAGMAPSEAVDAFVAIWTQVLELTDYRAGCPVVAVAAETPDDDEERRRLAAASARVFGDWAELLTRSAIEHGYERPRARTLATMVIASIEGAVVMSRAERSAEPLRAVGVELTRLLKTETVSSPEVTK